MTLQKGDRNTSHTPGTGGWRNPGWKGGGDSWHMGRRKGQNRGSRPWWWTDWSRTWRGWAPGWGTQERRAELVFEKTHHEPPSPDICLQVRFPRAEGPLAPVKHDGEGKGSKCSNRPCNTSCHHLLFRTSGPLFWCWPMVSCERGALLCSGSMIGHSLYFNGVVVPPKELIAQARSGWKRQDMAGLSCWLIPCYPLAGVTAREDPLGPNHTACTAGLFSEVHRAKCLQNFPQAGESGQSFL